MRVIDCDVCGETISAADDSELAGRLAEHHADRHDGLDEARAREQVAQSAYDAMDS
jgi:predicted small metal-binding protein